MHQMMRINLLTTLISIEVTFSMPNMKSKDQVYLTEEEKTILKEHLSEWTSQMDKPHKEAYLVSDILPKIQALNRDKFGEEKISIDKDAKTLWERRIKVSSST